MNMGFRTILLLAAVVLFVICVFANEHYSDLLALGLAAFAGAFLSDALGYADRTFSSTRSGTTNQT
jgi:H+/gluconate symporter-like permease